MYNWSVDEKKLIKNQQQYTIWKLEQMVNFGLNGEKIKIQEIKRHFSKLNIDPHRRKFLKYILYG